MQTQFTRRTRLECRGGDTITVRLMGGLGNQLFQAAAAYSFAPEREVLLLCDLGGIATDSRLMADLQGFSLPANFRFVTREQIRLPKVTGPLLIGSTSVGLRADQARSVRTLHKATQKMASLVLSIAARRRIQIASGFGTGFTPVTNRGRNELLMTGYFQSRVYAQNFRILMAEGYLTPSLDRDWVGQMRHIANKESPLMVHVRLGDYKGHPLFGVVGEDYYQRAFKVLQSRCEFGRIWIFSDEPARAPQYLPDAITSLNPRIITAPTNLVHPSSTLHVLSLGAAYLLTNSTFGYWGALLRDATSAPVVAPRPWFLNSKDSAGLVPDDWLVLDR